MTLTHPKIAEFIKALVEIPFNQTLGLKLDFLDTQEVAMRFSMKPELIGNFLHGILHGGVISSVLDMAGGMVVMSNAMAKHADKTMEELIAIIGKCSTIDLHISYLNPGRGETFIAKAFLDKAGNHISFARMELYNQEETLIATGNASYLIR